MNWIDKLERKYGRFCVPNLMLVIIVGQGMVFLANLLNPGIGIISKFTLFWPAVMRGEIWRLITFIFVPSAGSVFALIITLYFYYFIGHTLENTWGDFKFNVYYLCGMLGIIIASVIMGMGTAYYINMSLFFAFAMLYPDMQVLLFFIIPVKMKYLAFASAALTLLDFLTGDGATKMSIIFSLLNFLLFFGGDFLRTVKQEIKYAKTRKMWKQQNQNYRR
ncbi:MAG: rhomboid family intramembrane serine protease [Ruthenibacterium sp.]